MLHDPRSGSHQLRALFRQAKQGGSDALCHHAFEYPAHDQGDVCRAFDDLRGRSALCLIGYSVGTRKDIPKADFAFWILSSATRIWITT
jgi:hypothetical protein